MGREPAPPYRGEGAHALWHFSEDPDLGVFRPHVAATAAEEDEWVWAVDTRHAPLYWFPRDCPRGCVWVGPDTTEEDRERFFGHTAATRIHVIAVDWLDAMRAARLYAYRLPPGTFVPHSVGGYWVSTAEVEALERVEVADLLARHAEAGIELRITPDVWAFWTPVVASTLEFSGIRLRNATVADGG